MKNSKSKTLIYGIGNEILTDDGIGPKLVKELQKSNPTQDIDFETAFIGGLDILEYIQGYETVIFIDAIKTLNGVPGTVYYLTPEDFRETLHLSSVHDVSFLNAIKLGNTLGYVMPSGIHIVAIEIIEDRVFDDHFSPEIERKYPEILLEVRDFVEKLR